MADPFLQITGRKEIVDYCKERFGVTSWQSIRRWKRDYGFPIRHLPGGKPFVVVREVHRWAVNYDDAKRAQKAKFN